MQEAPPSLVMPHPPADSGGFLLRMEAQTTLDEAGIQAIVGIVEAWAGAAAHGAFPAAGVAPVRSGLRIDKARVDTPGALAFELQAQAIDVRAFQLLRSMAERLQRQRIAVRTVTVDMPAGSGRARSWPVITDESEFDSYPARSRQLRFAVTREPVDDRRLRRAVMDLHSPVTKGHVERLNAWMKPWFDMLDAGAWAHPVGPAYDVHCTSGSITLYDEQAVELCVNRFQASECAWDTMLNMLDACWPDERQIERVEID